MFSMKFSKFLHTLLISVAMIASLSFSQPASSDELLRLAKNLCEAAKSNDRSTMRKKLKLANIRLKSVYFGISCGSSGSLLRVATENNALEAASFIATKVGKKGINNKDSDGQTIIEWTEKLVASGDSQKQVFLDLYKSKS